MAAHGYARYTADVDLLTSSADVLNEKLWVPRFSGEIHRGDADDPLGGIVRLDLDPPHDLIVGRGFAMSHAVETAERHVGLGCPVATPPDLVLLKLEAGGPQDLLDIHSFVASQKTIDGAVWLDTLPSLVARCSPDARAAWRRLGLTG